jgi:HEAT repeat protein
MFDQEIWQNQIVEQLNAFARNPWQEVMVHGASTLIGYLSLRTLEPFLEAFQREPINAVLALSSITQGTGADHIVRRATQLRFQGARLLEREFHTTPMLCSTVEQLMVALNMLHLARQRLNSSRDDWLRQTLMHELGMYPPEIFTQIRQLLEDPGWKLRYEAISRLKNQRGNFTPSQLIMLSEGLKDSVSEVRTAAARRLGEFAQTPPIQLVKALVYVALHDCDMKTRNAAARSLGGLRERIASPEILDLLVEHLGDPDCFVRSATAMLLTELGEMAGIPKIVNKIVHLLQDSDPYVREAAAIALGRMGASAVSNEVMDALTLAGQDADSDVHEAAVESLLQLRKLRASMPMHKKTVSQPVHHALATPPPQAALSHTDTDPPTFSMNAKAANKLLQMS